MKTYKNLKKSTGFKLAIAALLICIGIVNVVLSLCVPANRNEPDVVGHLIADAVMFALITLYAVFGYKKPHGNLLRTVFLTFGVYILVCSSIPSAELSAQSEWICRITTGLAALLVGFIAGRLDRMEKNKVLMVVTGALLFVHTILVILAFPSNIIRVIGVSTYVIVWASLCLAYIARYEEHKAAGLEDK